MAISCSIRILVFRLFQEPSLACPAVILEDREVALVITDVLTFPLFVQF